MKNKVNFNQSLSTWEGKTIRRVLVKTDVENDCIDMVEDVRIEFTDGTVLRLGPDRRGQECFISQYTEDGQ